MAAIGADGRMSWELSLEIGDRHQTRCPQVQPWLQPPALITAASTAMPQRCWDAPQPWKLMGYFPAASTGLHKNGGRTYSAASAGGVPGARAPFAQGFISWHSNTAAANYGHSTPSMRNPAKSRTRRDSENTMELMTQQRWAGHAYHTLWTLALQTP